MKIPRFFLHLPVGCDIMPTKVSCVTYFERGMVMNEKEKEFLLKKFHNFQEKQKAKKIDFYSNPCIARIDPF